MNLLDLFEVQRKLDEEIERKHPVQPGEDRLAKKLLALSVELGECANEWRGFKFWSKTPFPKPPVHNWRASDDGMNQEWLPEWGYESYPLLEEYIDCLHFALSIGNEYADRHSSGRGPINYLEIVEYEDISIDEYTEQDITVQFLGIQNSIGLLADKTITPYNTEHAIEACRNIINHILGLGELLGFSWEQIIKAYNDKNKINWERQANGY